MTFRTWKILVLCLIYLFRINIIICRFQSMSESYAGPALPGVVDR